MIRWRPGPHQREREKKLSAHRGSIRARGERQRNKNKTLARDERVTSPEAYEPKEKKKKCRGFHMQKVKKKRSEESLRRDRGGRYIRNEGL